MVRPQDPTLYLVPGAKAEKQGARGTVCWLQGESVTVMWLPTANTQHHPGEMRPSSLFSQIGSEGSGKAPIWQAEATSGQDLWV